MHQQTNLNTSIALYIHIPFCNTLCPYCGFYKVKNQLDLEAPLITALSQEIKYYHTQFKQIPLHSIFFGGGTPSLLSVPALSSLFEHIHTTFKLTADCEITMEMNPENITPTLLSAYKQLGINRLSIGIQSFNPKDLSFLGRTHTIKDIKKALTTVCTHDQWNYNIDLITGLPHLTLEQLNHSLEHALSFKPTHISPYTLSIEPNTPFKKHGITPLNQSIESTHYHHIHTKLTAAHYTHYEVSAFSKPGYDSQHNCTYWKYDPFIGIGPSANSFFENRRYSHPPSVLE
jgi:oxygen-independent coproporphyrinogen-3 oxidase